MNRLNEILDTLLECGTITTMQHIAIHAACLFAQDNEVDFTDNYGIVSKDKINQLLQNKGCDV